MVELVLMIIINEFTTVYVNAINDDVVVSMLSGAFYAGLFFPVL